MKRVEITWVDSAAAHARPWIADDETIDIVECRTVGYLLKRNKRLTLVAQSLHDGGQRGNVLAIPTCSVTKVRRLR